MNQNQQQVIKVKADNQYDNKKQAMSLSGKLPLEVKGAAFNLTETIGLKKYYKFIVSLKQIEEKPKGYFVEEKSTLTSDNYSEDIHPKEKFITDKKEIFYIKIQWVQHIWFH
ncbi:hypothetical protein SCLARK_00427 [Spiroplasma clarkii]|uniref:hypothetical protein n=1 Tax=Spiroplasma clarkii TaxID=2139 RepID=UPI000B586344|nr:hypothetical protein [Spiroplasma clarkii]ARU91149.1 hypothetical protein SCLARK_00427 [Spiroplasma clarkii]